MPPFLCKGSKRPLYSLQVNPVVASSVIAQLLFLESQDDSKPIHLYINSPGGHVTDGLAIYDTMQVDYQP